MLRIILCLLLATSADAAIIGVPGDQPTIQSAFDASTSGDTVLVAAGTYHDVNLSFGGKAITVRSAEGPLETIIDPEKLIGGTPKVRFARKLAGATLSLHDGVRRAPRGGVPVRRRSPWRA